MTRWEFATLPLLRGPAFGALPSQQLLWSRDLALFGHRILFQRHVPDHPFAAALLSSGGRDGLSTSFE